MYRQTKGTPNNNPHSEREAAGYPPGAFRIKKSFVILKLKLHYFYFPSEINIYLTVIAVMILNSVADEIGKNLA